MTTRRTIDALGATLERDDGAPWDAPWSCARCHEVGPPVDFADLQPVVEWASRHAACVATKTARSR